MEAKVFGEVERERRLLHDGDVVLVLQRQRLLVVYVVHDDHDIGLR